MDLWVISYQTVRKGVTKVLEEEDITTAEMVLLITVAEARDKEVVEEAEAVRIVSAIIIVATRIAVLLLQRPQVMVSASSVTRGVMLHIIAPRK